MAERVLQQTCTFPKSTNLIVHAADVTIALPFVDWDIEQIDLEVPAGPSGALGFYLANSGQQWLPRSPGEYFTFDDRTESFMPTGYPTGGGWALVGHNNGAYDHVVIVRFHVNPVAGLIAASGPVPYVLTFVEHDVRERDPVVL